MLLATYSNLKSHALKCSPLPNFRNGLRGVWTAFKDRTRIYRRGRKLHDEASIQTPDATPVSGARGPGGLEGVSRPGGNTKIFLRQFCLSCCLAFSCVVTFGAGTVRNAWLRCCPGPPAPFVPIPKLPAPIASPPSRTADLAHFWPLGEICSFEL